MLRLPPTLSFYISRQFLKGFSAFFGIVFVVIFIINLIEFLRRAGNKPQVTFDVVLKLAFYNLFEAILAIIPFLVLFGTMYALWQMTRHQELVIARASGASVWQFLTPIALSATLIGLIAVTVLNPISAVMTVKFERIENKYLKGRTTTFNIAKSGLWLRQPYADGHALIHAEAMDTASLTLKPITILFFKGEDSYAGRLDAAQAKMTEGQWELSQVHFHIPQRKPEYRDQYILPTAFTLNRIQESFSPPTTVSFWDMPKFITLIESMGLSSLRHRMYFQSMLAQPFLLAAMVFLAAAFTPRTLRRGGGLMLIVVGLTTGFGLYILNQIAITFGTSGMAPVALSAWAPTAASMMGGIAALLQKEDG